MTYKPEHIELTEKIIQNSPGFKGNEDLLEEMVIETLKKASAFLESSLDESSLEVYLKKIAGNVIVAAVKNGSKLRQTKEKKNGTNGSFVEVPILYKTDEQGRINYELELPCPAEDSDTGIKPEKLDLIKEKIIKLDETNPDKNIKEIFEMRFVKGLNYKQTAKKLEVDEAEIKKSLLEILETVDSV